jgi:hypothetical protein
MAAASARELTCVRFALGESRLQRTIGQDDRGPDMDHRSEQKRPLLRGPYLRDVDRGLKTPNDKDHKKGFRRLICHVSTRTFLAFHALEGSLGRAVSLSWINLLAKYRHRPRGTAQR